MNEGRIVFIKGVYLPLSEGEIEEIRKLQSDWCIVTSEEEIDEILYETDFDGIVNRVAE